MRTMTVMMIMMEVELGLLMMIWWLSGHCRMGLCQGLYNESVHNGVSPDILSTQSVQCTYTLLTYYTLQLHYDVTTNSVDNGVWPEIVSLPSTLDLFIYFANILDFTCNCNERVLNVTLYTYLYNVYNTIYYTFHLQCTWNMQLQIFKIESGLIFSVHRVYSI